MDRPGRTQTNRQVIVTVAAALAPWSGIRLLLSLRRR